MRSLSTLALIAVALWLCPLAAMAQRMSDCGYYSYIRGASEGRYCASTSQDAPVQRVTALCRDQSYSYDPTRGACWDHGGVQTWRH